MDDTLPCSLRSSRGLLAPTQWAPALQRLEPGAVRTLRHLRGRLVQVQAGRLWITVANDPVDHFVSAGEGLRIGRDGPVVVQCDGGTAALFSC